MLRFMEGEGVKYDARICLRKWSFMKSGPRPMLFVYEADWSGVTDPEHVGRDMADFRYDLFDDLEGYCLDRAWEQLAEWLPEDDAIAAEAEKGFMMMAEEIINEWLADRRYGHPSLTAAERNPGLR